MGTRQLRFIIDTREQRPLVLPPVIQTDAIKWEVTTERGTLREGDYALADYPRQFAIERKGSVDELLQNLTRDRVRFLREVERLSTYKCRVLLIVGRPDAIASRNFATSLSPHAAQCLVDGILERGLPIRWAPTPEAAAAYVANAGRRFITRLESVEKSTARHAAPPPR